jgi:hypothetical protein
MQQTTPTSERDVTSTIERSDFAGTEAIEIPSADDTYDTSEEIG